MSRPSKRWERQGKDCQREHSRHMEQHLKKKKKASTWESPSTFLASAVLNCFTLSPNPVVNHVTLCSSGNAFLKRPGAIQSNGHKFSHHYVRTVQHHPFCPYHISEKKVFSPFSVCSFSSPNIYWVPTSGTLPGSGKQSWIRYSSYPEGLTVFWGTKCWRIK